MTKRTAGGAATIGGTVFQVEVAAWFAVQILAESHATPPFALPTYTTLRDILLETVQPTDDLKVSTSQRGFRAYDANPGREKSVTVNGTP